MTDTKRTMSLEELAASERYGAWCSPEYAQAALIKLSTTDVDLRHPAGEAIRILEVLRADDNERQYALDADDPSTAHPMSGYHRDLLMSCVVALVRMIDKTTSASQTQFSPRGCIVREEPKTPRKGPDGEWRQ